ncbi:MAG: HIT family protein [Candidatus Liptonbacteria bacterium]|nr:HIT family protein [Candidatus Liptonbacteria bacterium]
MDCIFCKIGKKEIPADMVYEDNNSFAILDIHPVAPGHTMVLPKIHADNLLALPEEEIGPLFEAVKTVLGKLKRALGPDGFTVGINHGSVSGQEIDHLHIHLIPRFKGDAGSSINSVVNNPPKETIQEIAEKIKKAG